MNDERKPFLGKVGVIVVATLAVLMILRVYFADREPNPEVSPPSTEWTTAPESGVDVNLPETPMINVPVETSEGEGGSNQGDDKE